MSTQYLEKALSATEIHAMLVEVKVLQRSHPPVSEWNDWGVGHGGCGRKTWSAEVWVRWMNGKMTVWDFFSFQRSEKKIDDIDERQAAQEENFLTMSCVT